VIVQILWKQSYSETLLCQSLKRGRRGRDRMVVGFMDLQLPLHSVPITAKVVSLNPVHGEMYLIQHYVIKFVSNLRQFGGFLQFPPPIKLTPTM
jgi:hypothetical protein